MRQLTLPQTICAACGKGTTIGFNRPNSLHKTKRVIKPNLQGYTDPETGFKVLLCTRCIRTLRQA